MGIYLQLTLSPMDYYKVLDNRTKRTTATFHYSDPPHRYFKEVWPTPCVSEFLRGLPRTENELPGNAWQVGRLDGEEGSRASPNNADRTTGSRRLRVAWVTVTALSSFNFKEEL